MEKVKNKGKTLGLMMLAVIMAVSFMTIATSPDAYAAKKLTSKNVTLSKTQFTVKPGFNSMDFAVQKPKVTVKYGKKTLKSGTDYSVGWSNKKSSKAGVYKVAVKGKGKYSGKIVKKYRINKAPLKRVEVSPRPDNPFSITPCPVYGFYAMPWYAKSVKSFKGRTEYTDFCVSDMTKPKDGKKIDVIWEYDGERYHQLDEPYYETGDTTDDGEYKILSGPVCSKDDWSKPGVVHFDIQTRGLKNFTGDASIHGFYYLWPERPHLVSVKKSGTKLNVEWTPSPESDGYCVIIMKNTNENSDKWYEVQGCETTSTTIDISKYKAGTYGVCIGNCLYTPNDPEYNDGETWYDGNFDYAGYKTFTIK